MGFQQYSFKVIYFSCEERRILNQVSKLPLQGLTCCQIPKFCVSRSELSSCWIKEASEIMSAMNSRRDYRGNRSALFDGIEEGGIRASSTYSSHEIDEHENDRALDGLQDRVLMLKRLTGDIHEEVESHNHMLDGMGNEMDSSRGMLSGTMDRLKTVFETKSSRRMATLVASFVVVFLIVYYLTK